MNDNISKETPHIFPGCLQQPIQILYLLFRLICKTFLESVLLHIRCPKQEIVRNNFLNVHQLYRFVRRTRSFPVLNLLQLALLE